jgi:hypothetical protein
MRERPRGRLARVTATGKWLRAVDLLAVSGLLLILLAQALGAPPRKFQYNSYAATAIATPAARSAARPTGIAAADSFQRRVASGWGSADKGGWWTLVGSPWAWSASPGAGSVTLGANGQELAYLSRLTVSNVDVVERVALPRCRARGTSCGAFVMGGAQSWLALHQRVRRQCVRW